MGGGPTLIRETGNRQEDQLQDKQCKEAISLMTHTNERDTIFQKMQETFNFRQAIYPQSWNLGISPVHVPKTFGHKRIGKSVFATSEVFYFSPALFSISCHLCYLSGSSRLQPSLQSRNSSQTSGKVALIQTKVAKRSRCPGTDPLLQRLLQSAGGEQVKSSGDHLQGKCLLV